MASLEDIAKQYGATELFGHADYEAALQQGYTDYEILKWIDANKDKVNPNNLSGEPGGLYDQIKRNSTAEADVTVLYLNNLGRLPDPGGLSTYVNMLRTTKPGEEPQATLSQIAEWMRGSSEGQNREGIIRKAYKTFLGREPDPKGLNDYLNGPLEPHEIVKALRDSPEAHVFKDALTNSYLESYSDLENDFKNNEYKYLSVSNKYDPNYLYALKHWNTYGKDENRVIPYTGLLQIDPSTGKLKLANQKFFSQPAWDKFNNLIKQFEATNGGNYKQLLEQGVSGLDDVARKNLLDNNGIKAIETYYLQNKIGEPWDAERYGAQPPIGGFDANYYAEQVPQAVSTWDNAVKGIAISGGGSTLRFSDLDITGRYTYETYLQQHYTNTGRYSGIRGNPAVEPKEAAQYEERLTDAELQVYRDQVLGLDPTGTSIDWDDTKRSLLEVSAEGAIQARDAQAQQVFGALAQDVLKQASAKLIEQKRKESNLDFYRGLPGFDEVFSINQSLADSILGDTGVGGILSITQDSEKTKEGLEESLSKITGIPSSNATIYNWQKWFDETLTQRYEQMTEIASPEDAQQMLEVEKEFAQNFIENYLNPRFNESKSMDEFISYIDVKEGEENIFQTQTALSALKDVANVRAKVFYDQIKSATGGGFDPDFYFDPTVDKNEIKANIYQQQKDQVEKDWEEAKLRGDQVKVGEYTWDEWAYYYGLNINDKNDFARLHYQIKGMGQGFDPAEDIVTLDDAKAYINNVVLPAIQETNLEIGDTPFLQFTTPEEFADELLEGISPEENNPEWEKVLKMYGLDPAASFEEVRQYIIDAVRTNQAKDIRESIKYLNEKKQRPTQSKLGVTYIERPEDYKTITPEDETPLYQAFKNAGYSGTEEEFYKDFMPDASLEEQKLLAKSLGGNLELKKLSTGDPFEALSTISSFFPELEDVVQEEDTTQDSSKSSYFRLFEDDETDASEKSDAAKSYISEFTGLFKGFNP